MPPGLEPPLLWLRKREEGGRAVVGGGCRRRRGVQDSSAHPPVRPDEAAAALAGRHHDSCGSTFRSRIPHRLELPCPVSQPSSPAPTALISTVDGSSTFEANLFPCRLLKMAGSRLLRRSRCPVATLLIVLNDQGIVDNLTEINQRSMWASRRLGEDEQLYLVHVQGIAGIGLPITLVVKKFQNVNGIVDDNLENRCKSEMILLASIRHNNIVNVLHFIQRENAIMLVYTYEVNGSLDHWLHWREEGDPPLSWPQRKAIAIAVAQGLCHLHHGCNRPIVHHNITSINILLDQNFKAVIASFGAALMNMAGLNQPLPIAGTVFGNFGYAAPEYGRAVSQLTEKVDTYSFGVVLLELVTGRVANGVDGQLARWARDNCSKLMVKKLEWFKIAMDKGFPDQAQYMEEMATVFRLGMDCTVDDPQQRPSMQMALK